tara:strand:+ start:3606 stop:3827 length:222 start_codon:yes stop_codon:yes gene_type:complete
MDTSFLDSYPPEMTQGAYKILEKIKVEEDIDMRVKLYGQLALVLENLKKKLDGYDTTDTKQRVDVQVTDIDAK